MKKGQRTQKKLEFGLKNKENRQKAGLKSCFWALVGTNRDESAFQGRRAGCRVLVFKSGLSRRDRDGWQVCTVCCLPESSIPLYVAELRSAERQYYAKQVSPSNLLVW